MAKRTLKILGTAAVFAVVLLTLRDKLPSPAQTVDALRTADTRWLLIGALAEFASMAMFARQQRRLLIAFGVRLPRHRALALSYSRSAISISLPAGSAVSAGYAFRQFRAGGADRAAATSVMVLSGLLSFAGLALLYLTGAIATNPALILAAIPVAAAVIVMPLPTPKVHTGRLAPLFNALATARDVAPRHWTLALGAAAMNWLTDLLCLYATARAFDLPLGLPELAGVYLTVQIVRQIPLTPGGIGVIEASLLAGLVSAGAGQPAAAAAVLAYRLLSCWLVLPLGLVGWMVLRRSDVVDGPVDDELGPGELGVGLRENRATIGPRRDVREEQPSHPGLARQLTGLFAGKVHPHRTGRGIGPRRFRQQHVDAVGELAQCDARPGVPGVGEDPAAVGDPQPERRGRVLDLERGDVERPDLDRSAAQRLEVVDVGEVGDRALGLVRRVRVRQARRCVLRRVQRQQARARRVRRRGMVAPEHGERADVGAVVGVQVREHERVEVERVGHRLQPGQRAVPQLDGHQEALGLQQVAGRGGVRPGDAAGAPEDGQSHVDTLRARRPDHAVVGARTPGAKPMNR